MANGKSIALTVVALLIGASGLGVGVYSMINYQIVEGPQGDPGLDGTDGIDGEDGTLDNLVAIWHQLDGSGADFNITLSDIQYNDSDYFSMPDATSISLSTPGWYRITYKFFLTGLISSELYNVALMKNEVVEKALEFIYLPPQTDQTVEDVTYVSSDGNDIVQMRCYSGIGDDFELSASPVFDQFVLEYVGDL